MPNINIAIRNKIARNLDETEYICGNSGFLIDFDFDAEWDEYEGKTARFVWNGGYQDIVFIGKWCEMPVISNTNTILCGVFAGDLCTTTPAVIRAKKSILCGNPAPAEAQPDVFEQMLTLFNNGLEETVQNANASEAAATRAETAQKNAESAVKNAAGRKVEGETFTIDGEEVTAKYGAEIFNCYILGNQAGNKAVGGYSHAEGLSTIAKGGSSHAEGGRTKATGQASHAEGEDTEASGWCSHAEGERTIASGTNQHVQGCCNIPYGDSDLSPFGKKYLHIVGNGKLISMSPEVTVQRSNAHTLDEGGNAWFAGAVECPFVVLTSPDGTRFKVTVDNSGALTASVL